MDAPYSGPTVSPAKREETQRNRGAESAVGRNVMGGAVQPWGFCRAGASGEGREDRGALTFSRILGHYPAQSARNRQLAPLSRKGGEGCEMKWEHSDPWWPLPIYCSKAGRISR